MPVTIQDDMFDIANMYPEPESERLLAALVTYGITGAEPARTEVWYPTFAAFMTRLEMSVQAITKAEQDKTSRSAAARKAARARWDAHANGCDGNADALQPHEDADADAMPTQSDRNAYEKENEKEKEKESEKEKENSESIDSIIDFFNETCGTSYRKSAKGTRSIINARLSEGFTEADCRKAISNMHAEWAHDPKMAQYLRPETIFRPTKFESYVQHVTPAKAESLFSEYDVCDGVIRVGIDDI